MGENQIGTMTWHAVRPETVLSELGTDPQHGLAAEQAAARLRHNGPNRLTPVRGTRTFVRFLQHRSSTSSSPLRPFPARSESGLMPPSFSASS